MLNCLCLRFILRSSEDRYSENNTSIRTSKCSACLWLCLHCSEAGPDFSENVSVSDRQQSYKSSTSSWVAIDWVCFCNSDFFCFNSWSSEIDFISSDSWKYIENDVAWIISHCQIFQELCPPPPLPEKNVHHPPPLIMGWYWTILLNLQSSWLLKYKKLFTWYCFIIAWQSARICSPSSFASFSFCKVCVNFVFVSYMDVWQLL